MTRWRFSSALLPDGWARDVLIEADDAGRIAAVTPDAANVPDAEPVAGAAIPGMPNLHSHAFQRALAGLTQRRGPKGDDFWSWREIMYRFVAALSPEAVEAVAAQAYVEMLKGGYTGVAEFHYLHNRPDGGAYDDPATLSHAVAAAAGAAGIRQTLLPVLYQTAGFGGAPPGEDQRRFVLSTDAYLDLVHGLRASILRASVGARSTVRIGIAPHSLRAAPPEALRDVVAGYTAMDPDGPIHIHIAEQSREIEDCVAWSGARPVEWLLANAAVDRRWTAIHATHMTATETAGLARSGAVAGLCPTTEADLGDGLFPLADFLAAGGAFGIGSDANVRLDAAEELRLLEYGQRLRGETRNVAAVEEGGSTGATLWRQAAEHGARAMGQAAGVFAPGSAADIVVLDTDHPGLVGRAGDALLDSLIFGPSDGAIRDVIVAGQWIVRDRRHRDEEAIAARFAATMRDLVGEL